MPPSSHSKPCHNCRRRRLRCDRSWPGCHKCAVAGQECLGYGKVFVWTQATGIVKNPPGRRQVAGSGASASGSASGSSIASGDQGGRGGGHGVAGNGGRGRSITSIGQHYQGQPASSPTLASLTDPLFQDLDHNSRYYLAHFADRVCKDLVARDAPGSNPFRELIPLTRKHPLLLQVLVATSAIHWSNIFRHFTPVPTGVADPKGYLALLRSKDLVSRQALIDALSAKQKAMGHLREVLDTLDPAGSEVALAAMHFFIKFDLIDLEKSDGKGWQAHLEAASGILALLGPKSVSGASSRMLRDCVIADCFMIAWSYHILGSTLTSGGLAARIARYAFELLPVMKRVEVNSYLSCPPEILQIILVASQLSYETPCTDWSLSAAGDALGLVDQALAFDIPAWAAHLQRFSNVADIESRVHVASAHRSAACLYILQALPLVRTVRAVDTALLVDDILGHLAQIGDKDPYFKATSWPTFIAGAETRDPEKRACTLARLLAIWEICPWGYIFTAIEMLKATWQMQDASAAGGVDVGVNWLQDLKGMGFDYLIV